jgi:hypothetical protein
LEIGDEQVNGRIHIRSRVAVNKVE